MEAVAPAVGRAQADLPSPLSHLKITRESLCGPTTFFLLFCSWFKHVSMAQVLLVQQPYTISPAQDHVVRGLTALKLLESLKNVIFAPGAQVSAWEPGLGLLSVVFEQDFSKQADASGDCMLAFGGTEERESLHGVKAGCRQSVSAAPTFYLTYSLDVHIFS